MLDFTVAIAQVSTGESSFNAFASIAASRRFTIALNQLTASSCCFWYCHPHYFQWIEILGPPPALSGDGVFCIDCLLVVQIPVCSTTCFMCWSRASCKNRNLLFLQNRYLRASFTDSRTLVLSYKMIVKRSNIWKWEDSKTTASKGLRTMCKKASLTSGKEFQASHADFFVFPKKEDVLSHPVKAWNGGKERDLSLPRFSLRVY